MTQTNPHGLRRIDRAARLYVLESGPAIGFDVAHAETLAAAQRLARPDLEPPAYRGTRRAFAAYRVALAAMPGPDIAATWSPAFLQVRGVTLHGEAWLSDRLEGEATWSGDVLLVEHRFGPDLLLGAHMEGMTVSLDGRTVDVAHH